MLGPAWPLHLLVVAVFYGVLAYRFDSRILLSLALASFAAWRGLSLSLAHASLGPGDVARLRWRGARDGRALRGRRNRDGPRREEGALRGRLGERRRSPRPRGSPVRRLRVAARLGRLALRAPRRLGGGRGGRVPLEAHAARSRRPSSRPTSACMRAVFSGGGGGFEGRLLLVAMLGPRRARGDLPRPPADEDSLRERGRGKEKRFSMKGEWAAAERVEEVRAAARGWKRAGAIGEGTLEEIFRRYPEPRTLPAPLWRVLSSLS